MFQRVRLSIIRNLFTVHSAMIHAIQVCRQLSSRIRMEHPGSKACSVRLSGMLHGTQYTHHNLKHMLPQHCITYNDVSLLIISTKL
jgi:hypothetical protein